MHEEEIKAKKDLSSNLSSIRFMIFFGFLLFFSNFQSSHMLVVIWIIYGFFSWLSKIF